MAQYQSSKGAKISTPGVSNSVVSQGSINGVVNPGGLDWTSQFLSLAASHSPKYTFQAISMHWYGSSSLTVTENGAMFSEQAGAMMQLAEDYGIPEVWVTEMGSGYDASAATEEVSLAFNSHQSLWHLWSVSTSLTFVGSASSVNSFNGLRAPI